MEKRIIAPQLPGNDATDITGDGSSNFILDLGSMQINVQVAGYLLPVPQTAYPVLTAPDIHVVDLLTTGTAVQTVADDTLGKEMRTILYDYIADQSTGDYDELALCMPNWGGTASGRSTADQTIAGVPCRVWEGMVRSLDSVEVAGEEDHYVYRFDFVVGDV